MLIDKEGMAPETPSIETKLTKNAIAHGIPVDTLMPYIESFKYGAFPHGGAGIGMERVVMLFCALDNIRKVSIFPRDPKRCAP